MKREAYRVLPEPAVTSAVGVTELRFVIEGKPQPKQRARRGKGGRWYTPRETREYEMRVRGAAVLAATHEAERWPVDYEGAVAVEVHVYWPDARRRDADNVAKSVLDGMQARPARSAAWRRGGGVILDDAQVRDLRVTTAIDRERPRVEVVVRTIGEAA